MLVCLSSRPKAALSFSKKRSIFISIPLHREGRVGSLGKMSNIKHKMFRRPQFVISQKRCIPGQKGELFLHMMVATRGWNGSLASGVVCDPSTQLDISCGSEFFYGNFLESFSCRESFPGGSSWSYLSNGCRVLALLLVSIQLTLSWQKSNSVLLNF